MTALNMILKEVDHLQDNELHLLIHILVDKIHTPPSVSAKPAESPFRKYRGRAKGVWQQDAQTYITESEMKNDFKRAFLDTALFIYLLEEQPDFSDRAEGFLDFCYANDVSLVTSMITYLEFCVKPYREQRLDLIADYQNLIREADIFVITLTLLDCDFAARLRAKYPGLKAFDALQLALAIKEGCDVFACNDKRLNVVKEIPILTLDEFENPDEMTLAETVENHEQDNSSRHVSGSASGV